MELDPEFAKKMAAANELQDLWVFVLDMLDGQVAEAVRRGWDEEKARAMVFLMFVKQMSVELPPPVAE